MRRNKKIKLVIAANLILHALNLAPNSTKIITSFPNNHPYLIQIARQTLSASCLIFCILAIATLYLSAASAYFLLIRSTTSYLFLLVASEIYGLSYYFCWRRSFYKFLFLISKLDIDSRDNSIFCFVFREVGSDGLSRLEPAIRLLIIYLRSINYLIFWSNSNKYSECEFF